MKRINECIIIERAEKGGWNPEMVNTKYPQDITCYSPKNGKYTAPFASVFQDRNFWRSLFSSAFKEVYEYFDGDFGEYVYAVEWLQQAKNFQNICLTDSYEKAIEWLVDITTPPSDDGGDNGDGV